MEQWIEDLKGMDTLSNHKQNLDTVLEAYLTSDYANCKTKRTQIILLFNHLQKLE
jgi:hypothetical protein